jgi:hypothetical protein
MSTIILENDTLRLEFDCSTGVLTGLTGIQTNWKILDRPHLGLSFRLLVPLPSERRNNPVHGEKQILTSLDVTPDNRCAVFTWDGVTSEYGGFHAIKLILEVKLGERQALFSLTIENRSAYTVENVYCPYLGDVQRPASQGWFKTFLPHYDSAKEWSLWPVYLNTRGYWGVDFPTQLGSSMDFGTPQAPFLLLRTEQQGLYVGANAPNSEAVAWQTELYPGYGSSMDEQVPEELSISGKDVATRFAAVHLPFINPGETRILTPISLEAFQGGWQAGADIYKQWRNTWMKMPRVPAWSKEPHAWQEIHMNSPEDELRIRYTNLVELGEDCARHGVKAIQLVGWNNGGQDQGNPSHDIDHRLGTFQEFKDAIARIQSLGVKVILFAKFTWADKATEWFRKDLIQQAIKDPSGDYYEFQGWQYQTATQLLDINTRRLIPMCFLSETYLRSCKLELTKMLDLGPDGILVDECMHHGPALLCFDAHHGHRLGAPVYANDRKLIQDFNRLSQPVNPDFLYAGEGCYDWEMEAYQLSYLRSASKTHIPLSRYLLPQAQFMTAVTGFNDRNMINQCLLYRYIISYEPFNYKGRLDDFPLTIEYGKKMDALRTELRAYFWDGEFRDEVGAHVTMDGQPHHPYAVFINRDNGKSGFAIANYDEKQTIVVEVELDNGQRLDRYRLVEEPAYRPVDKGILIPPCSAAVVI